MTNKFRGHKKGRSADRFLPLHVLNLGHNHGERLFQWPSSASVAPTCTWGDSQRKWLGDGNARSSAFLDGIESMESDRARALEIRIEKLKNKLEDIEGQLFRNRQANQNSWASWLMLVYLFGSAVAITISWSLYHSVMWTIIHGLGSWVYVSYYLTIPSKL